MKKYISLVLLSSLFLTSCGLQWEQTSVQSTLENKGTVEKTESIKEIVLDKVPTSQTLSEKEVDELKWKSISSEWVIKISDETIEQLRKDIEKESDTEKKLDKDTITIQ